MIEVDPGAVDDARVRLTRVRDAMAAACARAGRPEHSVSLLAVSKRQPLEAVVALIEAGQRAFGENYAQALRDRASALGEYPVAWHAIGPLQKNKVKYVARWASGFHALADVETARLLGELREIPLPCWLEVNVAGEETKHGVAPDAVPDLVAELREVPGVALVGLMCMPPVVPDDPEASRPHFARLRALAEAAGLPELSMGTTSDYPVAVEEGATWIRVGRELFGGRPG
ncbi:MAG: YggS family pyridoxal phosphate-dependent enzyme [Myxococcota bacterium]